MVFLILLSVAAGIALTWWLAAQLGFIGALLGLLLIPILVGVVVTVGDRLDPRQRHRVRDQSAHFDTNKPTMANYEGPITADRVTAFADEVSQAGEPFGTDAAQRDQAP